MKYDYYTQLKKIEEETGRDKTPPKEMTEEEKAASRAKLDAIWNEYWEMVGRRTIDPDRVKKYNHYAELAKELARSQRWDLELEQVNAEGKIIFTLPLAILQNHDDLLALSLLIHGADELFLENVQNDDLKINLTYNLYIAN